MRYILYVTVFMLLQLFSTGAALSLQWWLAPWSTATSQVAVWVIVFAISNILLVLSVKGALAHSYRWGSLWMLIMHFLMLTALIISLLYGGYWMLTSLTNVAVVQLVELNLVLRVLALLTFVGLFAYALYSAYVPVVRKLSIKIDKRLSPPLRIALANDLHIGRLFGNRAINKLHQLLMANQADILLMPGDIMDDDTKAFNEHNMAAGLATLCAAVPYGVYATLGNHDLYGHEQPISEALREAGVQLLNDEVLRIKHKGDPLWLVGRFDNHKSQRVDTTELLAQTNTVEPIILLDHRPSDIAKHSQLPIDLQVSGHTHNGQVFPANFIVKAINTIGYGYKAINQGHFVVSSGYGFWGIPFRLGSRAEIWLITLRGNDQ